MDGWTKIFIGNVDKEKLINVVREVKARWMYTDNVWPDGDRKRVPAIKATRDSAGQYWVWLNDRALTCLLLSCKDIPKFDPNKAKRDAETPMPPGFLLPESPSPE